MALDVTDIICKENMEAVSSLKNKPNMHWSQSTAFIKGVIMGKVIWIIRMIFITMIIITVGISSGHNGFSKRMMICCNANLFFVSS